METSHNSDRQPLWSSGLMSATNLPEWSESRMSRTMLFNFFFSHTPRCNFSSTLYPQSYRSARVPHRDRTTNSRPELLKRKQYLVKRPQSGLDTKTYWPTVSRKVTSTSTDPASRQRGRPTETGQQIPDPNSWKGSNICSNVHKVGSTPRHTDRPSAVK
jgi:hypothetical protein